MKLLELGNVCDQERGNGMQRNLLMLRDLGHLGSVNHQVLLNE